MALDCTRQSNYVLDCYGHTGPVLYQCPWVTSLFTSYQPGFPVRVYQLLPRVPSPGSQPVLACPMFSQPMTDVVAALEIELFAVNLSHLAAPFPGSPGSGSEARLQPLPHSLSSYQRGLKEDKLEVNPEICRESY